jgi:hypothetical protein
MLIHLTHAFYASGQTALVAIRTADGRIVVGNDAKVGANLTCKIARIGDSAYSFAGFALIKDATQKVTFDAVAIGRQICIQKRSLDDQATAFGNVFEMELKRAWSDLRQRDEKAFSAWLTESNGKALQVVLAGRSAGSTALYTWEFFVAPLGANGVSVHSKASRCASDCDGTNIVLFGEHERMDTLVHQWQGQFPPLGMTLVQAVDLLISEQARATPKKVGLPVDIIEVTPTGLHWRQKQAQCTDLPQPLNKK